MSEISILDLQNLRHLIGGFETSQCKMQDYASEAKDPELSMLDEKTMVSDALAGVNGELVRYGEMISQTENKELKQKLKQIRNDCEMSQEKLYQIAREKSYYVPAAKATDQEISHVKNILAGISTH